MNLRLFASVLTFGLVAGVASAQQPRGAREALDNMASQPAAHSSFTFDKDMLQSAAGLFGDQGNRYPDAKVRLFRIMKYRLDLVFGDVHDQRRRDSEAHAGGGLHSRLTSMDSLVRPLTAGEDPRELSRCG